MDVRNEKLARASDASGRSVQLTDWNTLTVDQLFDGLDRTIMNSRAIQIVFDSTWHYPTYTYSNSTAVVDGWSILEARALHVLAR